MSQRTVRPRLADRRAVPSGEKPPVRRPTRLPSLDDAVAMLSSNAITSGCKARSRPDGDPGDRADNHEPTDFIITSVPVRSLVVVGAKAS